MAAEFNTFPSRLFRDYEEYYIELPDKLAKEFGQKEIKIKSNFKGITPEEFYLMLAEKRLENEEMEENSKNNGGKTGGNLRSPAF